MEAVAIYCIIVAVVGALVAYLINAAPFLEATLKQIAVWGVIALTIRAHHLQASEPDLATPKRQRAAPEQCSKHRSRA